MITLHTTRHQLEAFIAQVFPYIELAKTTRLKNVRPDSSIREDYLSATLVNCVLEEVQEKMVRKFHTTKKPTIKFEWSNAQGVVLYKTLQYLHDNSNNIFLGMTRADWIGQLDRELFREKLYEQRHCMDGAFERFG
jgi:hypothetical protein